MTTDLIVQAQRFAHAAHDSIQQKRKYYDAPYWVHTDDVARIYFAATGDEIGTAIAHLHDVLEDVAPTFQGTYGFNQIASEFGRDVADGVFDLTDQYVKENYPQWNRATRKRKERERLGTVCSRSRSVKLADCISNCHDIVEHDGHGFAPTFIKEVWALLPYLRTGDFRLWCDLRESLNSAIQRLNIYL